MLSFQGTIWAIENSYYHFQTDKGEKLTVAKNQLAPWQAGQLKGLHSGNKVAFYYESDSLTSSTNFIKIYGQIIQLG